jgi:hypothetical protein
MTYCSALATGPTRGCRNAHFSNYIDVIISPAAPGNIIIATVSKSRRLLPTVPQYKQDKTINTVDRC